MTMTDLDGRPLAESVSRRRATLIVFDLDGSIRTTVYGQRRLANALLDPSANGLVLKPGDTILCVPPEPCEAFKE